MGCGNFFSGPNSNHRVEATVYRPWAQKHQIRNVQIRNLAVLDPLGLHRSAVPKHLALLCGLHVWLFDKTSI